VTSRRALAVLVALGTLTALTACGDGSGGGDGADTSVHATTSTTQGVRPPGEVRVFVINGAGIPMAAATKANELRGLGYAIAGVGNAPEHQPGTVVACRRGFVAEAAELSAAVGPTTTIVPFPQPAPDGVEQADCIVGLGT
jgi:LytR cell envelope-related transcriptional attenuator